MRKLGCFLVVLLYAGHFCSGATPTDSPTPAVLPSFVPDGPSSGQPKIPSEATEFSFEEFVLFDAQDTPDPNAFARLGELAQTGDPNAEYRLAHYHCRYTKDMPEMVKWLRAAALQSHVKAQFALGHCYGDGTGVSKDSVQAVAWYRKAAEQGLAEAQLEMVRRHRDGDGVPKDLNEAIKWLKRAAHQSPPDEQYDLARMFQNGDGIPQDSNEALYWYTKAAEQGHAEAQYELGAIYTFGRIRPTDTNDPEKAAALFSTGKEITEIPKNPKKAVEWLTKAAEQKHGVAIVILQSLYPKESANWFLQAAEQGSVKAQYFLGEMYHDGKGVPQDYKLAMKWLTKAAEQGDNSAQKTLALMYHTGDGVSRDYTEATKWWIKAAQAGDGDAQHRLGLMYFSGLGVPKDPQEALKWLTKAADRGAYGTDAAIKIRLAFTYSEGRDIPKDDDKAAQWFARAEKDPVLRFAQDGLRRFNRDHRFSPLAPQKLQDNATTAYLLGILYLQGLDAPEDRAEAIRWFTKAAELGLAEAQWTLGLMYIQNDAARRDATEAVKWLRKAAEQGLAEAQFTLSGMYGRDGVPKNEKEALKWLTKAAEQGHGHAQERLGLYHYGGLHGAIEDYVEAYKWFLLAEMNGADLGLKEQLRKEMTPSQIAEAQRAAKAFLRAQQLRSGEGGQNREAITAASTGFFITPAGYLLTARHVVEKTARVEVIHREKTYPAKVVLQDESTDVAVLKVEGSEFPCLSLVSSATVRPGDSVFTMGFPLVRVQGTEAKFTEGSISSLSGLRNSPRFFQISAPIQPGNSGGPLVNENGEVVGLIVSRLDDIAALMSTGAVPQTVNYALKSSFILPLIESVPGLAEKLPKGSAAKDRSAAIEKASQAVVLIVGYSDGADSKGSSPP